MNNKNLFYAFKHNNVVHKIAFTGLFLGHVILFQYLERFMPLGFGFIKINLSILFILPIFYFAGPPYGILVLVLRYFIGVGMSGGFNEITMISHFILLLCSTITIVIMYIFSALFNKIKNHNFKIILILFATLVISSILITLLNQVLFTPLYFAALDSVKSNKFHFSLSNSIKNYQYIKHFYFDINNYWIGTFITYFTGNLIKYTIVFIVYFPLSKILRLLAQNYSEIWK